jgi:nucleotide-binding universal stress UspA family protein
VQQRSISTAPAILDYANENDIDLIVMGTHGRRGLGHLLLVSVAEEVVRVASCPVLTIREHEEPTPIEAIEQILVPVDFSGHSKKALAYAKEMAATYNARLHLLHVIEDVKYPAFYMSGRLSYFDIVPEVEAKSREALKKFLEDAGMSEATADIHVIEGHAAGDIVKFAASHSIDLVVIATHGLTGLDHFLLGSVTEKVVRRAPCPVFTVKAFGKSLFSGTEGLS